MRKITGQTHTHTLPHTHTHGAKDLKGERGGMEREREGGRERKKEENKERNTLNTGTELPHIPKHTHSKETKTKDSQTEDELLAFPEVEILFPQPSARVEILGHSDLLARLQCRPSHHVDLVTCHHRHNQQQRQQQQQQGSIVVYDYHSFHF